MSLGKMNTLVQLIEIQTTKDPSGFSTENDILRASFRAYREGRHGTRAWANRAQFSEATDLFRFRCIPGVTVTTGMLLVCEDSRFSIISVEDVKGRRMYIEVLAKEVKPSG